MRDSSLTFFPQRLDRSSAPEQIGADAARIIENLEMDSAGRLKRRLGLAKVNVTVVDSNIDACAYFTRRDGVGLLLDSCQGALRLTQAPQVAWDDVDDFGARTTALWYENFNEDGPDS